MVDESPPITVWSEYVNVGVPETVMFLIMQLLSVPVNVAVTSSKEFAALLPDVDVHVRAEFTKTFFCTSILFAANVSVELLRLVSITLPPAPVSVIVNTEAFSKKQPSIFDVLSGTKNVHPEISDELSTLAYLILEVDANTLFLMLA
jgi:hypothetical protein